MSCRVLLVRHIFIYTIPMFSLFFSYLLAFITWQVHATTEWQPLCRFVELHTCETVEESRCDLCDCFQENGKDMFW